MKSTGSWYTVEGEDHQFYECRTRGKLRLEGSKETNPVAVGDQVEFDIEKGEGNITTILPRQNHMLRLSVKKTAQTQVLAANIDQVMLVASLKQPRTSVGFIDRFLVAAESFRIPQAIVFNKRDLLDEEELETLQDRMDLYQRIGVKVLSISAIADDVSEVASLLKDKITLIAGHSGVGKSTLLNHLNPELKLTTSKISHFSDKGTHTTTFAEMHRLSNDTYVIDTPGIKEWGLVDMNEQEISDYFPEMREVRLNCKFGSRCIHVSEPKCAVIAAVESGDISLSRYESYLSMVRGEDNRK